MATKFVTANTVGESSSQSAVSVDGATTSSITVNAGATKFVIQNAGNHNVWFGASNVDPANDIGIKLVPMQIYEFSNVTHSLTIYFKCASGETSKIANWGY